MCPYLERGSLQLQSSENKIIRVSPNPIWLASLWAEETWKHIQGRRPREDGGRDCCHEHRTDTDWVLGFPQSIEIDYRWWLSGKEPTCTCGRPRFNPWSRKIPWRRKWQPTPVTLPGKSLWTEESGGLPSMGSQRIGHDLVTKQQEARQDI